MKKTYLDIVSGEILEVGDGMFLGELDPRLRELVHARFPKAKSHDFISFSSLAEFREKRVEEIIAKSAGENAKIHEKFAKTVESEDFRETDIANYVASQRSFGQRVADGVAKVGGSWSFIICFIGFMVLWIVVNGVGLFGLKWDPYPFILLNLALSTLAAIQAPIIMMSQNRAADYDRMTSENDYKTNKKTEVELRILHSKIDHLIQKDQPEQLEIQKIHSETLAEIARKLEEISQKV